MAELDPQFRQSLGRLFGEAAGTEPDWQDVVARANRARRRSLVLALLASLSLVVFVSAALAFGNDVWKLVSGKPVSTKRLSAEERRMFAALATGKPVLRTQPNSPALRHLGRHLSVRLLANRGGFTFYVIEIKGRDPGRCFATGHAGRPELFGSMVCPLAAIGTDPSAFPSPENPVLDISSFELRAGDLRPHVFRLEGFAAVAVKTVGLLDEHDKVDARVPVINSTYLRATDLPRGRVEAIVAFDDAGHRVYCQDIAASDPCHTGAGRKGPTSPRPSTPKQPQPPPEPTPSRLGRQVQHGESQGASVDVYEPGVAIFDLRFASANLMRLAKAGSPGCLRARFLDGQWVTDELGSSGEAVGRPGDDRLRVDLVLPRRFGVEHAVPPPYDGCEIGGFYGHRWNDAFGTRAPLEIPLSLTGRRFFNDRAAARDLAYFVRSKRVQRIRLSSSPKPALIELARRFPSRVLELASPSERLRLLTRVNARRSLHGDMSVWPQGTARPLAVALLALAMAFAAARVSVAPAASVLRSGAPHRPLHLPHLRPGKRCPISPSQIAGWGADGRQTLTGRGPVYLIGDPTISIALSAHDSLGWQGQKTPWAVRRSYSGPILVRGARIGRRGQVRFAYGYGDHLRELHWDVGADQGLPPDPGYRFLASETLFRAPGCYAFQIDGTSFSKVIVVRVTG